jgi:hypothetical protein
VTSEIDRDDPVRRGELGELVAPICPVARPAVDEDECTRAAARRLEAYRDAVCRQRLFRPGLVYVVVFDGHGGTILGRMSQEGAQIRGRRSIQVRRVSFEAARL